MRSGSWHPSGAGDLPRRLERPADHVVATPAATERIFEIDWSGSGMPASVAQSYEDALEDESLLIRGSIVAAPDASESKLAVKEIWLTNTPEAVEGVYT